MYKLLLDNEAIHALYDSVEYREKLVRDGLSSLAHPEAPKIAQRLTDHAVEAIRAANPLTC